MFREDDLLRAATGMLTAIGQPALVPLSEYLGGAPDPETCHRVSAVLGIIGQERAIPFLRPLLASSDRQRQQCAITALEQIRDANAIRSIEHMLSEEDRAALLASRNIVAAYNNDVDVDKAAIVLRTFADGISAARMNAEQQRVQSAMLADAEQVHLLLSSANRDALVTLGNAVVEPLSRAIPKAFMEDLEHVADVLGRARSPLAITGLLQIVDLASHWTFSPGTGGSSASYEVAAHNMRVARTYEAVTLALFRIGPPGLDRLKNELTNQTDDVRLKLAQVLVEIEHDSDLARPRPN